MSTPFIGEVRAFSFTFAPQGWLACDGSLLPIMENRALYSLLGTTYGGDGKSTFGLPNIPGLQAADDTSLVYCIAIVGVFPARP